MRPPDDLPPLCLLRSSLPHEATGRGSLSTGWVWCRHKVQVIKLILAKSVDGVGKTASAVSRSEQTGGSDRLFIVRVETKLDTIIGPEPSPERAAKPGNARGQVFGVRGAKHDEAVVAVD